MSFKSLSKVPLLQAVLLQLAEWRITEKLREITPHLRQTDHVLDIGSGNGVLCRALRKRNYQITALDIDNLSFFEDVEPIIYDGVNMPFEDDCFDVALLITVLHHAPVPEQVLAEARRVAKRVIVIEEIYSGPLNRLLTYFIDSLFNLEFIGHPHTNKTDRGWREVFEHLGLTLVDVRYTKSILILNRVTYVLAKE